MSELISGDIFCNDMKLIGREAFIVIKKKSKTVICKSRKTGNEIEKRYY